MKRLLRVLLFLGSLFLSGCATEREYFLNHNPFTDTLLFLGNSYESFHSTSIDNVRYSDDEPTEIRPL